MANEPWLSISSKYKDEDDPKGKVFPFHLNIPSRLNDQPVQLHPNIPISAEIVQAKNGKPKKYCVKAYCVPSDEEQKDTIKVQEVFWDRIDDPDVELDLDVKVVPQDADPNELQLASARSIGTSSPRPTKVVSAKRKYEDMPVDDP